MHLYQKAFWGESKLVESEKFKQVKLGNLVQFLENRLNSNFDFDYSQQKKVPNYQDIIRKYKSYQIAYYHKFYTCFTHNVRHPLDLWPSLNNEKRRNLEKVVYWRGIFDSTLVEATASFQSWHERHTFLRDLNIKKRNIIHHWGDEDNETFPNRIRESAWSDSKIYSAITKYQNMLESQTQESIDKNFPELKKENEIIIDPVKTVDVRIDNRKLRFNIRTDISVADGSGYLTHIKYIPERDLVTREFYAGIDYMMGILTAIAFTTDKQRVEWDFNGEGGKNLRSKLSNNRIIFRSIIDDERTGSHKLKQNVLDIADDDFDIDRALATLTYIADIMDDPEIFAIYQNEGQIYGDIYPILTNSPEQPAYTGSFMGFAEQ